MKCSEIIEYLETLAPSYLAESWDNVGLLVGRLDKEVRKVMVALDPSGDVISQAVKLGADMLITHHPLIFSGMKSVTREDFIGRRVCELIGADISYYAMHTNFDVMGMADAVADKLELQKCQVLDVTFQDDIAMEGIGRIGKLPRTMTLKECAEYITKKCGLSSVRIFGEEESRIEKAALVPGSGKDYLGQAITKGADVLITGDIGHHHGLDAMERGIAVIDAGHFGLEQIFSDYMEEVLRRELHGVEIHKATEKEPFRVIGL